MYPALFLVAILYLYIVKEEKSKLFKYSALVAVLVFFPVTRGLFDKYFQGFYGKAAYEWLFPIFVVVAFVVADMYGRQNAGWKKYVIIPAGCLIICLSGNLSKDAYPVKSDVKLSEIEEVYEMVLEMGGGREINLVAPREIMENARAFDGRILTAYGRDIWETDLDYAFYGNYDEWAYRLSEYMDEPLEDNEELFYDQLVQAGATHVVFDKENLTYDENMDYPPTIRYETMSLKRVGETHHYVVYAE